MFHQPPPGLGQTLLQTRQRPVLDPSGQSQPPHKLPSCTPAGSARPHSVGAEPIAREASHLYGLLAFLEIYLHILKWAGEKLVLKGIPAKINRASVLTNGDVRFTQTNEGIEVSVPPASLGDRIRSLAVNAK